MMNNKIDVSFIIPAFNEADVIGNTLNALKAHCKDISYEVLLVDNGSTDDTAKIAAPLCTKVIDFPAGDTIAEVRNKGISEAVGNTFIFLDADILLTEQWSQNIGESLSAIQQEPMLVTGSKYTPPKQELWLNKYWYNLSNKKAANYINSGHLIVSRQLCSLINGFDESLKTAEDYDFCRRAIDNGAILKANSELRVIHEGYPEVVKDFIQRERWHGREDFESIDKFKDSKIAWITALHMWLLVSMLCSIIFLGEVAVSGYLIIMAFICAFLVHLKFGFISASHMANSSVIFYFYIWGRTLALIDKLFGRYTSNFRK